MILFLLLISMTEADIINDCIDIVKRNKYNYIPKIEIKTEIDNYYDNYKDIYDALEHEFITYVKTKLNESHYLSERYRLYGKKELEYWFLDDEEFKGSMTKIRNLSNLEYYVYLNNKVYSSKINCLEAKINYLSIVFIIFTFFQILNHISIY